MITRLALVLSLGVVVSIPSLYLFTGLSYEQQRVASESRDIANDVESLVSTNPQMWPFLGDRIDYILSQGSRVESGLENRVVVFASVQTADGSVVSQLGRPSDWLVTTATSVIRNDGGVAGKIVLTESVAHVWRRAGLALVAALILGYVVFVTMRVLPLRALDRSIRERDDAQAALTDLNAALEEKVASRTVELEITLRQTEAANRAKSSFLSSMSHELRTPMNAILGFGQLLGEKIRARREPKEIAAIDNIMLAGRHLLELINQVLELTAVDGKQIALSMANVPLAASIKECMDVMNAAAVEKQIQMIGPDFTKPLPIVKADRLRLKQVLFNMVSNAIKYNREGGSVSVLCQPVEGNRVRITVADTGLGIPAEQQDLLFMPFERLGRESGKIEGTGIGLAICKSLIEAMDGKMGFESTEGVGSRFHFDLACVDGAEVDVEETMPGEQTDMNLGPPPADAEIGLVLYVEDNSLSLKLMEAIFENIDGVDLIIAQNGEMGLAIARDRRPGLILMDIDLPGMDGIQCFQKLREHDETADIPVVAVSAGGMPDDIRKITRAGFDDYLTKPIDVTELSELVGHYFAQGQPPAL